jgi:2-dehydro-3-deoxyphosphogluconate aldolase/(4S)-4-hydroxy-2-oxoglutarate aldolase
MRRDGIVAVVRAPRVLDPMQLVSCLVESGIRCVEFTWTTPNALDALRSAADGGGIVGMGTVLDARQAREAADAGASFIVTPGLRPVVAEVCIEMGVPIIIGALTPSEVLQAMEAGAGAVKLFPARLGGPRYLRDLRGPLPSLRAIPSGGVDASNARDYFAAGAFAVSAGSNLIDESAAASGAHGEIAARAAELRRLLDEGREADTIPEPDYVPSDPSAQQGTTAP